MTNQEIYALLRSGGLTRAGALGVMGNMMAESSMIPNIAQRGMTKLTDAQYTAAADNGLIDFVHDQVGYGLCQWTYYTRKAALLDLARNRGVSVGDPKMQCEFCLYELKTDGGALFHTLTHSEDIDLCSDMVCSQYERPAVNNYQARRNFAHKFAEELSDKTEPVIPRKFNESIASLQVVLKANEYWSGDIDGVYSHDLYETLLDFADGMKQVWEGGK